MERFYENFLEETRRRYFAMSSPSVTPEPQPDEPRRGTSPLARWIGALVLVAVISAGTAYGVFEWRIRREQQDTAAQVAALSTELRERQDQLTEQVDRVEQAAKDAKLLFDQNGETVTLDARLKEIDTLKQALQKNQDEMETKLKTMQNAVLEQVTKQGQETAQALSLEMRWKNLLVKAQGEVLLTQVHWAEGNRGLAKDELNIAAKTLQQAAEEASDDVKPDLKQVVDLAEQAKSSLILQQPSARDALNLLWHRVSELLAPPAKG